MLGGEEGRRKCEGSGVLENGKEVGTSVKTARIGV